MPAIKNNDIDFFALAKKKKKVAKFKEGDRVECKYNGKGKKYYPGRIESDNKNGCYDVVYDDGDIDKDLEESAIREYKDPTPPPTISSEDSEEAAARAELEKMKIPYTDKVKLIHDSIDSIFELKSKP